MSLLLRGYCCAVADGTEHLNSLESTLNGKDMQIKLARDDAERLRREVENLKRRLSKYEKC